VCKAGKRAFAPFYRADFPVPSEDFYDSDGHLVLQILSDGKQCVIPPSIHPETKQPYRWTNGHSLYDTPLSELPLLPRDYRERLERLGYVSARKPKKAETADLADGDRDEHDDRFSEIKQEALRNLAAWVPDLGLYGLKRNPGRGASFRSVASFRPSKTDRPNEERDLNLNIHPRGITDEGDNGKGYSAIDLVMACLNCNNVRALEWLEEKLLPPKSNIEVDWEKLAETQDAPKTALGGGDGAEFTNGASTDDESYPEMEKDLEIVGTLWSPSDPLPEPKPMTVPYFVPSRTEPCIGYIGAITGSAKTFTADDLAVAIATNGFFAGQQVTERGAVVLIEMEGSSRVRLKAAIQYRGIETLNLPIYHSQKMPPVILNKGEISKEWRDWCARIVRLLRWRIQREWGLPLTAIILDPLAHFSGITDIGSFAENTAVSKALIDLALKAQCLVIIVDHYGKDTTRGLIGSIARESLAYFVLTPGDKLSGELSKSRQLIVRKMRDGMNNICVDYRLHVWDTKTKQIVSGDNFDIPLEDQATRTLVIEWGKEVRRWSETEDGGDNGNLTPNQRLVLNKVNEFLNSEGVEPPAECDAPAGLRAVSWVRLWPRLRQQGLSQSGATRARTDLLAKRLIGVHDDWIWITLGGE
jgi:hypothetical protein